MISVVVVAGAFSAGRVAEASTCLEIDADQFDFPARAVYALVERRAGGNAVVPFNWGQFIIWHLGPEVQVSGDGRRETAYSREVHQANLDFANGVADWDRILDLAPADMVIQVTGTPGAMLLAEKDGWEVIYQDRVATVLAQDGSRTQLAGDPLIPDNGHGMCFPRELDA
jgi:hypothetical protein